MKSRLFCTGRFSAVRTGFSTLLFCAAALFSDHTFAQTRESLEFSVRAYNGLFSTLAPGQSTAPIGDMLYDVDQLKRWRDHLQNRLEGRIEAEGGFDFTIGKHWADSVVPYTYDKSMPAANRTLFESALREWQENASINFVPWTGQANYLLIKFTGYDPDAPMNSYVGMRGGAQVINVAGWGNKTDCAHELGHALGMAHEQCRSDRDLYVTIIASNLTVNPKTDVNYAIVPKSINRTAYDYDSLMHYPRDAFATNGMINLVAKSPNEKWSDGFGPDEIGQKTHLSVGDKAAMAAEYGSPLTIGGTVSDAAGHALAGVKVTLSGGANYRGSNPVSTGSDGTYSFIGIPKNSGTYTVTPTQPGTSFTQASRNAAIQTASQTSVDFTTVDSAPPDLTIISPAVSGVYSSAPVASGTASDSVGLKEVRVALARTSDLIWWNWNENTWGTTTFDWTKNVRIAGGKSNWSTALPNLGVGGYQAHVQSVDGADNASPWLFRHFFVDPDPPVVAVTQPIPNSTFAELMTIRGTATDGAGTGIKDNRVYFTLYQNGDFWTGFNWKANTSAQDPDVLLSADVVDGQWIYNSVPGHHDEHSSAGSNERSGTYYVSLFARDNAGNLSVPTPGVNSVQFTIDNSPPGVAIKDPETGSTVTNLLAISGTATDSKTLAAVRLYLFRYSDGQFWDGRAWGGGGSAILPVTIDTNKGTWASSGPLPSVASRDPANRLANGGYDIIAFAVDAAGNQTRIDSIITVEYFPQFTYTAGSFSDNDPLNNNDNWDNPANWSPYGVPGGDDMAVVASGSPIFTGTKTIHGVKLTGGNLRGDKVVIPAGGVMTWLDGTLSANLTIDPGADLVLTGTGTKTVASGKRVEINGESHWDGVSQVAGSGGVVFRNNGNITADGEIGFTYYNNGVYPIGVFENFGTLIKQGSGTFTFGADYGGWALTNAGTLNISGGSILLKNTTYLGGRISGTGRLVEQGGLLNIDGTTTLDGGSVELHAGNLDGGGSFDGSGTFIWTGGTIRGDLLVGSTVNFALAGGDKTIASNARVRNAGHAVWGSGNLLTSGNSRLENTGTFEINGNVTAVYYNNGVYPKGEFINLGTVVKKGSATALFNSDYGGLHFNNRGELQVNEGVLILNGGGDSSRAIFSVQAGARLDLASGDAHSFSELIQIKGAGRMRLTGATLTGSNAVVQIDAGATLEHSSGTTTGTMALEGPGRFEWSGGTLNAAMEWRPSLNILISGTEIKNIEGGRIAQNGTAVWTGSGSIRATGQGEIRNNGLFEVQNDSSFIYYNNGVYPAPSFINNGLFKKSVATASTLFAADYGGWTLTNSGSIEIQSGRLDLNVGVSFGPGGNLSGAGATRIIGGTATIYGTNTIQSGTLELAGGTILSDSGRLVGDGTFAWTSGSFGGNTTIGTTNFAISGDADKILNSGSVLRNAGSAVWTGNGAIRTSGASVIENAGRFEARNDATLYYYNNGVYPRAAFNNHGTFVKAAGTNGTIFANDYSGTAFNNSGAVVVQSGTLALGGGGAWSGGSYSASNGSELKLFYGTFELTNSPSFGGVTRISGGDVALKQATINLLAGGTLILQSGSLSGAGTFSGTGTLGWNGGTMAGALKLAQGVTWALDGADDKLFASGTIDNYGAASWNGTGAFKSQGNALLNNYGTFVLKSDALFTFYNNGVYPRARLNNYGLMVKSGGTGISAFSPDYGGWLFANNGTIQVDTGVLSLRTENIFTNAIVRGSGRVRIDGGSVAMSGTTTLDGGTIELATGSIGGAPIFTGPGAFEWSGGELQGNVAIGAAGNLSITGTADKSIAGGSTLQNDGAITWYGGAIRGAGQSRFVNRGLFTAASDSFFAFYNNGVYPIATIENTGTIRKSGSTGKTFLHADYGGWKFVNSGTLDIQSGTFDVGGNYEPSATTRTALTIGGAAVGSGYSSLNFPGIANLAGTLIVSLTNNFLPLTNSSFTLVTYASRSGNDQFVSPVLPALGSGRSWRINYQPNGMTLGIGVAAANSAPTRTANGHFQISLNGPAGLYALFQGSSNLVDWVNIQTNLPFSGHFDFSDASATNTSKFYRTIIVQ